jgi:hypothetical protein
MCEAVPSFQGIPTSCVPGLSILWVFGRSLAFANGQCVPYNNSGWGDETAPAAGPAAAATLQLSRDGVEEVVVHAAGSSCYTARFELPASLTPGNWSWSVKNSLEGSTLQSVVEDLEQRSITVAKPPLSALSSGADGSVQEAHHGWPGDVPAGDVPALLAALNASKSASPGSPGTSVSLPAGTWKMGALDRLMIPDGVTLGGAGADKTKLLWPTQTGMMCASFKAVNFGGPGLISGPDAGATLGWAVMDLEIFIDGGLQQNDTVTGGTHAYCPIVTDYTTKIYNAPTSGMRLERVIINSVAPHAGVDMWAGGVGSGAAVVIGGTNSAVKNCTITHIGNCGSNVTPLLDLSGINTIISGNTFNFGCTLYSMRGGDFRQLLYKDNVASHYKSLGRDGSVIGTFAAPFRTEHLAFLGNHQVDNPETPPGCTPVSSGGLCTKEPAAACTAHRLETLTLDGGGGAYTGSIAQSSGLQLTLAGDPFSNGTGAYMPLANLLRSKWVGAAAMILAGKGAGQWRHVTNHSGREWLLDRPWAVEPDATSQLQIAPMRGHILIVGNTYDTGFTVQLYAMCLSGVVVENTFNATPLISWGRNPHNWGYQPNWRIELIGNTMPNSSGLTVQTGDQAVPGDYPWLYSGPLATGVVVRKNWVDGHGIRVQWDANATGAPGPSEVVIELNSVSQTGGVPGMAPIAIKENASTHILVRANTFFPKDSVK